MQMYLLQSPLRPPWRPYELDKAENVRLSDHKFSLKHCIADRSRTP